MRLRVARKVIFGVCSLPRPLTARRAGRRLRKTHTVELRTPPEGDFTYIYIVVRRRAPPGGPES